MLIREVGAMKCDLRGDHCVRPDRWAAWLGRNHVACIEIATALEDSLAIILIYIPQKIPVRPLGLKVRTIPSIWHVTQLLACRWERMQSYPRNEDGVLVLRMRASVVLVV